jgi:maltose-binding protein MalE
MKKIIIALLMIFAAFVFSANIIRPKADDGTIRIWVGAISREKEVMEDLAAEFKEKTGVTVKVYQKLEIFTVPAALVNNAELEERPDIVYMQAPDIGGLVKSGYLQPLEISAEMRGRFCPVAFEAFTFNNEVYGVGYSNSAYGLIYNKDLIATEDLPETWEDLFAKAEELTIADDDGNITQRGLYLNATDMWFNYPLIREYGGYYYGRHANGDYNAYDVGLDNPGMLDYVAKIKELKAKGMVLNNPNKKRLQRYHRRVRGGQGRDVFLRFVVGANFSKRRGELRHRAASR